jgi:hypothetical protein
VAPAVPAPGLIHVSAGSRRREFHPAGRGFHWMRPLVHGFAHRACVADPGAVLRRAKPS